jgi:hypothetical protein
MINENSKKNLKMWKKGESGNPTGRPKLPPELKSIHALSVPEVQKIISKYCRMTMEELLACKQDPKLAALDRMIISGIMQAERHGDYSRLEMLLVRTIGRVTDKMEISTPKPYVIERSDGKQVVLGSTVEEE